MFSSMKVLVLGGTRFIGPPVVRRLLAVGCEVTRFHRGKTPGAGDTGSRTILGDRRPLTPHIDLLREEAPDVVLDMIALTEEDGRQMMDAFRGIAKRVVVISSMDVYQVFGRMLGSEPGGATDEIVTEESPLRTKWYPYRGEVPRADDDPQKVLDDYDKIPMERFVLGNPDLPGTVLRLPMVYGPGDYQHRLYEYVKRMRDGRSFIVIQNSFASWRTTRGYVEDVADGIFRAVVDDRAAGQVFNIADPTFYREAEWIRLIGDALGWSGEIIELPEEALPAPMRVQFDPRQHLTVDSSKIRRILNWDSRTDPKAAIRTTAEYELANPPGNFVADYAAEDDLASSAKMGT
jgi:nucleoside-diphosphate-sugar epimerase